MMRKSVLVRGADGGSFAGGQLGAPGLPDPAENSEVALPHIYGTTRRVILHHPLDSRRRVYALAAVLALALALPATSAAQSLASVQGFVSDGTGASLPGVTIELVDLERGQRRTAVTNQGGYFALRAVPSGEYDLVASLAGFRTSRREGVRLLVGQSLEVDLRLGLAAVEETVVVTGQAPLLEVGRTGVAGYVTEDEIDNLPISGRDFVRFALLKPTVQVDARGRISLSGQRAVNSGLTIDGADAKSAFFGFGRGGLAREGGGALVAQESVQEFQVVTSGYSAEAGRSGGGAMNVITKSGTNELSGSGVLFLRDDRMAARLPRSPLDAARGVPADDARYEVDEFRRYNWGASLGGPIRRDRTHFFFSYDQTAQNQPFLRDIRGRGQYDAVRSAFPELVAGYLPNDDGIAAADPDRGRTASGRFLRETDNLILFGKLNHRATERHALALRYNYTDYARVSDFVGEESRRFVKSHSTVGSVVSVVGESGVNELRVQYAYDDFDRHSHLPGSALQAHFAIYNPSFGSFGKPWWLPVTNDERKLEIQERFSFVSGNHELRAGFSLSHDALSEFFVGNADGAYDFDTLQDFAAGTPARAVIFFGSMENPNFVVSQQILGAYVQDSWSPNRRLTLQAGARWDGTVNPGSIEHVLPEGRRIPNDLDNFSPRAGLVWSPDPGSVVRAAGGVFHARTPTLLFSTAHTDTGIYPRYGNAIVSPGETGFVPLGGPIDNDSPPRGLIPALSHFDPGFEDPRTIRFNLGYEREIRGDVAASLDLLHARSIHVVKCDPPGACGSSCSDERCLSGGWCPVLSWPLWLPSAVLFEQRVGEDEQLAHDGDQSDLSRFSLGDELPVLRPQVRIAAHCRHGRHVEDSPHLRPAGLDEASALPGAGLSRDGGEPREAGDRLGVESAEFRHLDEQACGGDTGHARNGGQDLGPSGECCVFGEPLSDLGINGGQMPVELRQLRLVLLLEQALSSVLLAVECSGAVPDQCVTRHSEFLEGAPRG